MNFQVCYFLYYCMIKHITIRPTYIKGYRHLTNRQVVPVMVVVIALITAVIITNNDGRDNYGPSIYCYYGLMSDPRYDPL